MAECLIQLGEANQALGVLESVTPRTRNSRANMLLGDLYKKSGMERSAITAYKEVIKVIISSR